MWMIHQIIDGADRRPECRFATFMINGEQFITIGGDRDLFLSYTSPTLTNGTLVCV